MIIVIHVVESNSVKDAKDGMKKSYCKEDHKKVCKGLKASSVRTCKSCEETKVIATEFYETKYTCKGCLIQKAQCPACKTNTLSRNLAHHMTIPSVQSDAERKCTHCKVEKSLKQFHISKYTCIDCMKIKIKCDFCEK